MTIQTRNIHSLTDFQRNSAQHLRNLRASGLPEVLTVNGKAELVVQSAEAYQVLLDRLDLADSAAAIHRGLADHAAGRSRSVEAFDARMKRRHPELKRTR